MTQTQTNASAQVVVTLAAVSLETASQFAKAVAQAAASNSTAMAKADRDLLGNTVKAARLIGVTLSEAQWSKQFAAGVRKAIEAKRVADVAGALSRAKTVTLAVLSGDANAQPVAGETINSFCTRVRPLLGEIKLADGQWLMTRNPDGTAIVKGGAKPGSKKPATPPKPAASAGDASKQEGGLNVSPAMAAASILLPDDADAANRLAIVAAQFPDRLAKFTADLLAIEANTALTRAKERKAA